MDTRTKDMSARSYVFAKTTVTVLHVAQKIEELHIKTAIMNAKDRFRACYHGHQVKVIKPRVKNDTIMMKFYS